MMKVSKKTVFVTGALAVLALLVGDEDDDLPKAPKPPAPPEPNDPVDGPWHWGAGSLRNMAGVHPWLVAVMHRALEMSPTDFTVISGLRTQAEQIRLVDEKKSDCDPRKGCISKHMQGRALDVAPIIDGKVELLDKRPFQPLSKTIKAAARDLGVPVRWGGSFTSPTFGEGGDVFHWELTSDAPDVATTDGYRRAQQSEVTPKMTRLARSSLAYPLGSVRGPFVAENGSLFLVKLEEHSNAPKGASVFLKDYGQGGQA